MSSPTAGNAACNLHDHQDQDQEEAPSSSPVKKEFVPDSRPMVPPRNQNCPLCRARKQYRRPDYEKFTSGMMEYWFELLREGFRVATRPDANGVVSPYPHHDAAVYADNMMNEYTARFGMET